MSFLGGRFWIHKRGVWGLTASPSRVQGLGFRAESLGSVV